jgi:hypothetical protein
MNHDRECAERHDPSGPGDPTILATALYIEELSAELSGMARRSKLEVLAYLLDLARAEAEMQVRGTNRLFGS